MSAELISYDGYVAGWLDTSIQGFLERISITPNIRYALVTCLDSNPSPALLLNRSPELKPIADKAKRIGAGFLCPTHLLLEHGNVFFGFDEVSFFPSKGIAPKPASASLVGPSRLDQSTVNRIGKWMNSNSCSLALGDGEGLNFVVKAQGLVRHVLGHSIRQHQQSLNTLQVVGSR